MSKVTDQARYVLEFLQKTYGSHEGGTRAAIDWLVDNQDRLALDVFNEVSELLVTHEAWLSMTAQERLDDQLQTGSSPGVLAEVDQTTPVIDLTGSSGSGATNPRVIEPVDQSTPVDDYSRLKANQKSGKYVGKFKPFGRSRDEM